jgi:ferric uptake regulator family protein
MPTQRRRHSASTNQQPHPLPQDWRYSILAIVSTGRRGHCLSAPPTKCGSAGLGFPCPSLQRLGRGEPAQQFLSPCGRQVGVEQVRLPAAADLLGAPALDGGPCPGSLTEAPQRSTKPHWDRPVNSEPRPCLFSVGFPLSGPQVRTSTSDLIRHALRTSTSPYGLATKATGLPRSPSPAGPATLHNTLAAPIRGPVRFRNRVHPALSGRPLRTPLSVELWASAILSGGASLQREAEVSAGRRAARRREQHSRTRRSGSHRRGSAALRRSAWRGSCSSACWRRRGGESGRRCSRCRLVRLGFRLAPAFGLGSGRVQADIRCQGCASPPTRSAGHGPASGCSAGLLRLTAQCGRHRQGMGRDRCHLTLGVYDALAALTDKGLLRRIQPAGSPVRYENRVGDNHHHHLICRTCSRMVDVDCAAGYTP